MCNDWRVGSFRILKVRHSNSVCTSLAILNFLSHTEKTRKKPPHLHRGASSSTMEFGVNLAKGENARLPDSATTYTVGLGWDPEEQEGVQFDLDAAAFMLNSAGKIPDNKHFVFFNNLASPCGALVHQGDNRDGEGEGDDEQIVCNLAALSPAIDKLVLCATIYEAETRKQNFGQVNNAYIRICEGKVGRTQGTPVVRYNLQEDFASATAIVFGEIYRYQGGWKFRAVGKGYKGGFNTLLGHYTQQKK